MSKIGFVGLGVMGFPMAGHLQAARHEVTVYNRTAAKAQRWKEHHGGNTAATPAAAAAGCEAVMVCVGNDDDVRSVVFGDEGALSSMQEGSLLVDHTTASAELAGEIAAAAAERGIGFVDAPVSGGQAGAENGQLAIMCGGSRDDFDRAEPIMCSYAKACEHFGPAGAGQLTKMVNQICIAGIVQGLSEGLHFAARAGLDPKKVAGLVAKGAGGSWQMDNRAETMVDNHFDHGFAVNWMRKDLAIAIGAARRLGVSLPVAALVDQFYADVQALGGGHWDTSALIQRLRVLSGEPIG